jgi:hypothetical protein
MTIRPLAGIPVLAALALSASASAQVFLTAPEIRRSVVFSVDVGPQYGRPIGEFRTNVERAWGVGTAARVAVRHFPLGLRADFAYLNYGNERKRVALSPTVNRVIVKQNTSNNIALVTGGPELAIRRGPIQPYAYAFAGWSYLFTQSSVGDDNGDGGGIASSTNFDDGGWASGWGAGVRIPLNTRRVDIALDAGARLTRNGARRYLTRGDITDQPDGTLQFNERRTAVDFWQYQIGASFSSRRSRSR